MFGGRSTTRHKHTQLEEALAEIKVDLEEIRADVKSLKADVGVLKANTEDLHHELA